MTEPDIRMIQILESTERRFDEAGLWIAKLDRGLSADDAVALRSWLASAPENREVFLEMSALWDNLDLLAQLSELFPQRMPKRRSRFFSPVGIAASVFIIAFAGLLGLLTLAPQPLTHTQAPISASVTATHQTRIGERSTITLPDATELILNTNSLVHVKYSTNRRILVLEKGELYVKVATDKTRPLSVFAGEQEIRAVGTEFNVEISSDQRIELVVTEGKVLVGVHAQQPTSEQAFNRSTLPLSASEVTQGQTTILGISENTVGDISAEEIAVKLSWQQGNLVFRGESLEAAVDEIGRYTPVEFVIADERLKLLRISGLFKAGDVEGLLATLKENFDIAHTYSEKGNVILNSVSYESTNATQGQDVQ